MKIKTNARAWTVRYTRPKTVAYVNADARVYEYNYCSIIVSESAGNAIDVLKSEHPDSTVISVNPNCTGPVMIDAKAITE